MKNVFAILSFGLFVLAAQLPGLALAGGPKCGPGYCFDNQGGCSPCGGRRPTRSLESGGSDGLLQACQQLLPKPRVGEKRR